MNLTSLMEIKARGRKDLLLVALPTALMKARAAARLAGGRYIWDRPRSVT